jgi:hypothetical protein
MGSRTAKLADGALCSDLKHQPDLVPIVGAFGGKGALQRRHVVCGLREGKFDRVGVPREKGQNCPVVIGKGGHIKVNVQKVDALFGSEFLALFVGASSDAHRNAQRFTAQHFRQQFPVMDVNAMADIRKGQRFGQGVFNAGQFWVPDATGPAR